METSIRVGGMTCEHWVRAVHDEIASLEGVSRVAVDLETGAVVITSEPPLQESAIADAVSRAGYEVEP